MRVRLIGPNGIKLPPVLALVDSGADASLFPREMMAEFGIDEADCDILDGQTANGQAEYHHWPHGTIETEVLGRTVQLRATFCSTSRILLGRCDFFAEFSVSFDERAQKFRLEAY